MTTQLDNAFAELVALVPPALKVTHLKKFLGLKLSYAPVEDFEVLVALENQCVVLNDQLSLGQIVAHFATDADVEVVLHYRLQRPMGT